MPSPRVQRQIDRLLDEAEQAIVVHDWIQVQALAREVLSLDPENQDGAGFLASADRMLAVEQTPSVGAGGSPAPPASGVGARFIAPGSEQGQHSQQQAAGAGGSPALPAAPPPVSFANGRYEVRKFLGEGGKKKVYLAHDTVLDRDVAFALIKTDGLDDIARERIAREAQAMGRLGAHPHIVTVFDLGEEPGVPSLGPSTGVTPHPNPLPQGEREPSSTGVGARFIAPASQPYMVTELMGGGDVEGLIQRNPDHKLPLEQAVSIAEQVCQGLAFAHGRGIVHRDLKPGNVWLTEPAGSRQPATGDGGETAAGSPLPAAAAVAKIGDFGLAVAVDRTRLTQAGMMVGTVSYMPPEQATGGEITPRSDLYSLGAMLYEMVTGRPPFVGDEAVAIIGQHLNTPPIAPVWHRPDCPPGLESLILRLLEKDPTKRPASAAEVEAALESIRMLVTGAVNRAPTHGGGNPLSPAGEGQGEGESPAGADGRGLSDNPLYRRAFVGREAELRQLHAAFDAALSGRGGLVMVVGEPGIGKTSVCEQLATYAALRGGKALAGHCYEEGSLSLPYLPFVEAMRSYVLAREPEGLKADLGSGAGEVARIVSEVRDRVQVSPSDPGEPEEQRWRLLQAVTTFLRNASLVQPLLLILEDLHDADRGTLDLLLHLSRNLDGARLLVAGTYRDVEVDRSHPLSGALAELRRNQSFLRVPLRGLTGDEVQRMMQSVSQQEIPWPLAELVHRQTEGNPLFVQEVLRYLVEERLVERRSGSLRRVGEESLAGRIPEGLRDVIGKRLSRLSDATNRVLATASVIGRDFRLDVLQSVAGLPAEEVEAALEQAAAVAVVEERSSAGAIGFRFTHAFFRQTLYEEIFVPRRIRLHQQVARALVQVYGRRAEEHAAELAEHFAQTTDREDLEQALRYARVAAERAMGVYAYGEAARHLEQALKIQELLDPDDDATRCDLLLALGEAMLPGEDPERVVTVVAERAYELAGALTDRHRSARASLMALEATERGRATTRTYQSAEYRKWAERSDRQALPTGPERVFTDSYLAQQALFTAGPSAAHPFLRRAIEGALDGDDARSLYMAAGFTFRAFRALRDRGRLFEIANEVRVRPRAGARPVDLASCLLSLGSVLLAGGDRAGAENTWAELSELAAQTGDITIRAMASEPGATLLSIEGRLEEAVALAEKVQAERDQLGIRAVFWGVDLADFRALINLGRLSEALERFAAPASRPERASRSIALAHLGLHDEARAIRDLFSEIESESDESSTAIMLGLLEAAVLRADLGTAAALGRRLATLSIYPCDPWSLVSPGRLLGAAAVLAGDFRQALEYFLQAIQACEAIRFRPELALTRLQLAELLLEHYPGERAEALEHLDFAIAELRAMKMQPWLERALRHKDVLKA